jgi:hypothetical protein
MAEVGVCSAPTPVVFWRMNASSAASDVGVLRVGWILRLACIKHGGVAGGLDWRLALAGVSRQGVVAFGVWHFSVSAARALAGCSAHFLGWAKITNAFLPPYREL